eukprot:3978409-Prymnesium_polylepis.1
MSTTIGPIASPKSQEAMPPITSFCDGVLLLTDGSMADSFTASNLGISRLHSQRNRITGKMMRLHPIKFGDTLLFWVRRARRDEVRVKQPRERLSATRAPSPPSHTSTISLRHERECY